tara:strand:- start:1924 stop:2415 length:492 start_codon:yes stop_codon:yes gene_type:complete
MLNKIFLSFFFIFFIVTTSNLYANSQGYRDELPELKRLTDLSIGIRRINKGLKYEKKNKYKKANKMYTEAINFLLEANKNQNIDPNIFFYLGFAYNKLKNYENAEIYYSLGLTLDPKNSYINLYIGELYLNTRRVNLAEERLKVLSDCNCIEYNELKESISKF